MTDDDEWLVSAAHMYRMMFDRGYRGAAILRAESGLILHAARTGRAFRPGAIARAMMPRTHDVRVEGRRDADGTMMFLRSDPGRPSAVYRRKLGHGTVGAG